MRMLQSTMVLTLALAGCSGNPLDSGGGGTPSVTDDAQASGVIFKGPMRVGGTVMLTPLDEYAEPVGEPVETTVEENDGTYTVLLNHHGLVELRAEGTVLDESNGQDSEETLSLLAIGRLEGDGDLQVNVITDLTYLRIRALLAEGLNHTEAEAQARAELLAAMPVDIDLGPETSGAALSPYGDGPEQSWLFAASAVIAQLGRDDPDRTLGESMRRIREDLEDGVLTQPGLDDLEAAMVSLNPDVAAYSLWLTLATVGRGAETPDLDVALDSDLDGITNDKDTCRYSYDPEQATVSGSSVGAACDTRLRSISTGPLLGCGVLARDGRVVCWPVEGEPAGGTPPRPDTAPVLGAPWEITTDAGLTGTYTDIAVGADIACAVTDDAAGAVACWRAGQASLLTLASEPFDRVAVSGDWICARAQASQAVRCFDRTGSATYVGDEPVADLGMVGEQEVCVRRSADGSLACSGGTTPPAGLGFTQLSATPGSSGSGWACAVAADGSLSCFGDGVLAGAPTGTGFREVAVGEVAACAADASGALSCWYGDPACHESPDMPEQVGALSAGACQICGLDADGLGTCWPRYWDFEAPE